MNEVCKYLMIKDMSLYYGDILDHPDYEYSCCLRRVKLPFGHIHCRMCHSFTDTKEDD